MHFWSEPRALILLELWNFNYNLCWWEIFLLGKKAGSRPKRKGRRFNWKINLHTFDSFSSIFVMREYCCLFCSRLIGRLIFSSLAGFWTIFVQDNHGRSSSRLQSTPCDYSLSSLYILIMVCSWAYGINSRISVSCRSCKIKLKRLGVWCFFFLKIIERRRWQSCHSSPRCP